MQVLEEPGGQAKQNDSICSCKGLHLTVYLEAPFIDSHLLPGYSSGKIPEIKKMTLEHRNCQIQKDLGCVLNVQVWNLCF